MDQFSISFPAGSVVCAAGDYLARHDSDEGWEVFRVEDLLLVKRLLPVLNDPSAMLIEEHMLDSMPPAYADEVQLLLTAFDPNFTDESEALQAIRNQTLTPRVKGLLRSAREFPESECWVVHPQTEHSAQTRPGSA